MDNNNTYQAGNFDFAGRFVCELATDDAQAALVAYRDAEMTVYRTTAKGVRTTVDLHDLRDAAGLVAAFGCGRGTTCSCR